MITDGVDMPRRATKGSAGYDFYAPHDIELRPGEWVDVDTGVKFDGKEMLKCPMTKSTSPSKQLYETPWIGEWDHWVMLLFPRSGLGTKYGVRFRNTVGVIDMSYRDNIRACLTSDVPVTIHKGERFMQGIVISFRMFADEIEPTEERKGGHGSTGA